MFLRLKGKRSCIGTIAGIFSTETAEVLPVVGFDWMDDKSVDSKGSLLFNVREMEEIATVDKMATAILKTMEPRYMKDILNQITFPSKHLR